PGSPRREARRREGPARAGPARPGAGGAPRVGLGPGGGSVRAMGELYKPYQLLEGAGRGLGGPRAFDSTLFHLARALVRHAEERGKPSARRLREYQDANLDPLHQLQYSHDT